MTGAVINLAGEVQARHELPIAGAKGDDAVALVHQLAADLIAMTDRPVLGIGVGSPGVVDAAGTVIDAPNLAWTDTPLAASLAEALERPRLRRQRRQHRRPRRAHLRRRPATAA